MPHGVMPFQGVLVFDPLYQGTICSSVNRQLFAEVMFGVTFAVTEIGFDHRFGIEPMFKMSSFRPSFLFIQRMREARDIVVNWLSRGCC